MKRQVETTVIMRTKNSAAYLEQTLKALFSQAYRNFELHIVDSSSTDNTLGIAERFPCEVRVINAADYFPGKVLNAAVEAARTPIVVFLNSDAVMLSEEALGTLVAAVKKRDVDAAFARQVPRPEAAPWVRREYEINFPRYGNPPPWITYSLPLAAMRRSAWKKRPFYTWAWGSEDTEWGRWARESGVGLRYVPRSMVMHSENYNLKQLYGRKFIEGEADAYIYRDQSLGVGRLLGRCLKATLLDFASYLRSWDFFGLLMVPLRRVVYYWAYFKGFRWGLWRLRNNSSEAILGQDIVLQSYQK